MAAQSYIISPVLVNLWSLVAYPPWWESQDTCLLLATPVWGVSACPYLYWINIWSPEESLPPCMVSCRHALEDVTMTCLINRTACSWRRPEWEAAPTHPLTPTPRFGRRPDMKVPKSFFSFHASLSSGIHLRMMHASQKLGLSSVFLFINDPF